MYKKKTTFSNLSADSQRKERSAQATQFKNKKTITKKIKKDREKRLREFREWWA